MPKVKNILELIQIENKIMKKNEEADKQKKDLLEEFSKVLSIISAQIHGTKFDISSINQSAIGKFQIKYKEAITADTLCNPPIQISIEMDKESCENLAILNEKLKTLYEKQLLIEVLTKKINESAADYSDTEKNIIRILLINNFLKSKTHQLVETKFRKCENFLACLELLGNYSSIVKSRYIQNIMRQSSKMLSKHFYASNQGSQPKLKCVNSNPLLVDETARLKKLYDDDCQRLLKEFKESLDSSSKEHVYRTLSLIDKLTELRKDILQIKSTFDQMIGVNFVESLFSCSFDDFDSLIKFDEVKLKIQSIFDEFNQQKEKVVKFINDIKTEIDMFVYENSPRIQSRNIDYSHECCIEKPINDIKTQLESCLLLL